MPRARALTALTALLAASTVALGGVAQAQEARERGELTVSVLSKDTKKDGRAPARLKLLAVLKTPEGVDAAACAQGGSVRFIAAKGLRRLKAATRPLEADCTTTVTITLSKSARKVKAISFSASFTGNAALASTSSKSVTFKAK